MLLLWLLLLLRGGSEGGCSGLGELRLVEGGECFLLLERGERGLGGCLDGGRARGREGVVGACWRGSLGLGRGLGAGCPGVVGVCWDDGFRLLLLLGLLLLLLLGVWVIVLR